MPLNDEQQALVADNLGLVGAVIKGSVRNINLIGLFSYQDIFQIGCLGLCKAAAKHNPEKGKFGTYAYKAIRNEIFDALDYASVRRDREFAADIEYVAGSMDTFYEMSAVIDLVRLVDSARGRASGVTAKGIDAIRLIAAGYSNREIGEMMGGVSANNVTAWVSKARAFLKCDPAIYGFGEAV